MAVTRIAAAEARADHRPYEHRLASPADDDDLLGAARGLVFATLVAVPFWTVTIAVIIAFT